MASSGRKNQQFIIFGLFVVIIIGVLVFINSMMNNSSPGLSVGGGTAAIDDQIVRDVTSRASPEYTLANNLTERVVQTESELQNLNGSLVTLIEKFDALVGPDGTLTTIQDQIIAQQQQLNELDVRSGGLTGNPPPVAQDGLDFIDRNGMPRVGQGVSDSEIFGSNPSLPGESPAPLGSGNTSSFGQSFELSASPQPEKSSNVRELRNYIPAGSYAPGVVLSGADAAVGTNSMDDPVPVTIRISGDAITSGFNSGRGQRIPIEGCVAQGAARGEISSERVYVRLTTLTCSRGPHHVVEAKVSGAVVGSGKAGVRGHVTSREGNLAFNAGVAGALQGLSAAASGIQGNIASQDGASLSSIADAAGLGAVGGSIGSASSTLAEYYVGRLEQYQPVVSLYPGTEVEVVFIEGVDLS